jgi:hypothetical protein
LFGKELQEFKTTLGISVERNFSLKCRARVRKQGKNRRERDYIENKEFNPDGKIINFLFGKENNV